MISIVGLMYLKMGVGFSDTVKLMLCRMGLIHCTIFWLDIICAPPSHFSVLKRLFGFCLINVLQH